MLNEEALEHFKAVCEREFKFLVEEYAFVPEPSPPKEFKNRFKYRLGNGAISLVVEGIGYGRDAIVILQDKNGRFVSIGCLLPGWEPFAKKKRSKKLDALNQDEQVALAARQLKKYGQDILRGELGRLNEIGDRLNRIRYRLWGHQGS